MTQRYWIGVVGGDHADYAVKSGICAFSHGKRTAIEKLSDGDRFVYYCPKTGYREGDIIQSFTALGTVIDATPVAHSWEGRDLWVGRAAYAAVTAAPVRPLLQPLSFVKNPTRWGMAFRRSMFEITEPDFDLIARAMRTEAPHD
jgi:predicted RNA-binding protein